jgi:hypothetical protein
MMAVPHQQEQSEPHSYPSTERGRFSCISPTPFTACHSHIQATFNDVLTSIIGKCDLLYSGHVYGQRRSGHIAASIQSKRRTGRITCGTLSALLPASHPPHSSHRLVTTDLHARRCSNHISCTYTRTSNLFIISSLRYNQLRPTNPAVDLSTERTMNSYSTINAAFQYKN